MISRFFKNAHRVTTLIACTLLASTILPVSAAIGVGDDYDVLNLPAMQSPLATKTWLHAIEKAADRLIAVGHRGHIVYSDDGGDTWTQADVPVRSDLTAVDFSSPEIGWVGGHEGVILHTTDGGKTWTKQLDGYQFNDLALSHYQQLAEQDPENELYPILIGEAEFALEQGADRPWYAIEINERGEGYALGAYGLMAVTYDGVNWQPIIEAVENHDGFNHIYSYEKLGVDDFILVGERGSVWYQPEPNVAWKRVSPFYTGSLYTVVSSEDGEVVVSGMRGSTYRSTDKGFTWQKIEIPVAESMVASVRLTDGRLVLASAAGSILVSDDRGLSFSVVPIQNSGPFTDLVEVSPGMLVLTGMKGVRKIDLDNPSQ